jgi:hypothetical protein
LACVALLNVGLVPAGELMTVQVPTPIVAVFPANVVVLAQILWFAPASATVGGEVLVMTISLIEGGPLPLAIVHLNV